MMMMTRGRKANKRSRFVFCIRRNSTESSVKFSDLMILIFLTQNLVPWCCPPLDPLKGKWWLAKNWPLSRNTIIFIVQFELIFLRHQSAFCFAWTINWKKLGTSLGLARRSLGHLSINWVLLFVICLVVLNLLHAPSDCSPNRERRDFDNIWPFPVVASESGKNIFFTLMNLLTDFRVSECSALNHDFSRRKKCRYHRRLKSVSVRNEACLVENVPLMLSSHPTHKTSRHGAGKSG